VPFVGPIVATVLVARCGTGRPERELDRAYAGWRSSSSRLRADDTDGLTADHEVMLAMLLLTAAPVTAAMAAAPIFAVTAALAGKRIADHRRQIGVGDALTDEQVEEQVTRRLGYAPRRSTASA
jgi:hypothetical protein